MPAVGIADRATMAGVMEFAEAAVARGIQPIIGMALPVVPAARTGGGLLILYVQNEVGYKNLLRLSSKAYLESVDEDGGAGVSLDALTESAEGLLCLTGGIEGPLATTLVGHGREAAASLLKNLARIFPNRLYVELQRHDTEAEREAEPSVLGLALEQGIPLVATNHVLFRDPDFFEAHKILLCIAANRRIFDKDAPQRTERHCLRSAAEMTTCFHNVPEAVLNTTVIAERCSFFPQKAEPSLPAFDSSGGGDEKSKLRADAEKGLEQRLEQVTLSATREDYTRRLNHELNIIGTAGFEGYFLIVADFVQWARAQLIPVGPGRGSGAGSLVAWALTITDLDPLRWGLVFERFLNPERRSMPDFDIDFCQDRRDEVISYVLERYGEKRVAQIGTYGSLQARAALRDVGRVLGAPSGLIGRMCNTVPRLAGDLKETKAQAASGLAALCAESTEAQRVYDFAVQIEGLPRHASTHAAGIVISDRPLTETVPLFREQGAKFPATQFSMKWVERAGLVKFDLLGLRTLSILEEAVRQVRLREPKFRLEEIAQDDAYTYERLSHADTVGVFQLESQGMRDVLRRSRPTCFEDIIVLVALYRPGPMENISDYVARKSGQQKVEFPHPKLEPLLRETYGIVVYQEQVLEIARELAGYSYARADVLRRAMGKKDPKEMESERTTFEAGAVERGIPQAQASSLFDMMSQFADYGFNKSHAAAYALLAYQTAFMKYHYAAEYLASVMTYEMQTADRLRAYCQELRELEIDLALPDINRSGARFTVERDDPDGEPRVCYALAAIRNLGEGAARAIAAERERGGAYRSADDLVQRLPPGVLNKRGLEQLAAAGAFDSLGANRRAVYESAQASVRNARDHEGGGDAFSLLADVEAPVVGAGSARAAKTWDTHDTLHHEFAALGLYLSDHPLAADAEALRSAGVLTLREVADVQGDSGRRLKVAGVVVEVTRRMSRKRTPYVNARLSDPTGLCEATAFARVLSEHGDLLVSGSQVVADMVAEPMKGGDGVRLTIMDLTPLETFLSHRNPSALRLVLEGGESLERLATTLREAKSGTGTVRLVCREPGKGRAEMLLPRKLELSRALRATLGALPGVAAEGEAGEAGGS